MKSDCLSLNIRFCRLSKKLYRLELTLKVRQRTYPENQSPLLNNLYVLLIKWPNQRLVACSLFYYPCHSSKDKTFFPKTQKTECWQYCFKAEKKEKKWRRKSKENTSPVFLLKFCEKKTKMWVLAVIYLIIQSTDMKSYE